MTDSKQELRETIQKATGSAYLNGIAAEDIKSILDDARTRVERLEATEE